MAARFPMAVVVTGSPLTVTIEGASAVVAAEDFVGNLKTGDRVQAAFLGDRLAVQQLAGGPPQSTTATADTLALRDASARIKAADGVAADDVATVGQLDGEVAKLPTAMESGFQASSGTLANGAGINVTVNFASGRFSTAPNVVVAPRASSRNNISVTAVSTTSFTVNLSNFSGATAPDTGFQWIAVQD